MSKRVATIDPAIAASRRRFFLERAFRLRTLGTGSDLERLMALPRSNKGEMATKFFGDIPVMLVGAHAANAFMPPRHTDDVDVLVPHARFAETENKLQSEGWKKLRNLMFPNAKLGLYGSAWSHGENGEELDLISSAQEWVKAAFSVEKSHDQNNVRVLPLPFLSLMKLDSARATDQGDLSRMLGRLNDQQVEEIVKVVERFYDDHQAPEDIRQYAAIGRWEYEQENVQNPSDRPPDRPR